MKLFKYELKKNILRLPVLLLFAALILVSLYKHNETVQLYGTQDYLADGLMHNIYQAYKGEITDEKIQRIAAYRNEMSAIVSSSDFDYPTTPDDRYYTGFAFGDNGSSEKVIEEMKYAIEYINNIIVLREKTQTAIAFYEGKNDYKVREAQQIERLYGNRHIDVYGNYDTYALYFDYEFSTFISMIMVLFVFAPSFSKQKAISDDKIICACGKVKSVFFAKHLCMYAFCAAITVIMTFTDILSFGCRYGIEFLEQPIYAIHSFTYAPLDISIFTAILITAFMRFLLTVFIGEIVLLISSTQKNIGISYAMSFCAIGALIYLHGSVPSQFSPFSMICMSNFFTDAKFVNVLGFPVLNIIFLPILTILLCVTVNLICFAVACPQRAIRLTGKARSNAI